MSDPMEPRTRFLDDEGGRVPSQPGWWQRRSGGQRTAIIGISAVFVLGTIGNLIPDDEPTTAGAGTTPSPTAAAATPTPRPAATRRPTPVPTPELGRRPVGPTVTGLVVDVVDGDTIKVEVNGAVFSVRYIGIDTPETVHPTQPVEWMGQEASAANEALVAGQEVVLEKDISETDQFGRLLRYVWLERPSGWLLVNLELVRLGFANSSTYPPDVAYQNLFLKAESEARNANVGLWGATPTPIPTSAPTPAPPPPPTAAPGNCHPSYQGACLLIGIGDYDCAGGSGNGPNYVRGLINVVGYDEFGLDGDGDGVGCE